MISSLPRYCLSPTAVMSEHCECQQPISPITLELEVPQPWCLALSHCFATFCDRTHHTGGPRQCRVEGAFVSRAATAVAGARPQASAAMVENCFCSERMLPLPAG